MRGQDRGQPLEPSLLPVAFFRKFYQLSNAWCYFNRYLGFTITLVYLDLSLKGTVSALPWYLSFSPLFFQVLVSDAPRGLFPGQGMAAGHASGAASRLARCSSQDCGVSL